MYEDEEMYNFSALVQALLTISFFILLIMCIIIIHGIYLCDNFTCVPFERAEKGGTPGTAAYTIALLEQLYADGIWPFAYISAAFATVLVLWYLNAPITIITFAIPFFIIFAATYFAFSFIGHHYIRFITQYAIDYIENNCPAAVTNEEVGDAVV